MCYPCMSAVVMPVMVSLSEKYHRCFLEGKVSVMNYLVQFMHSADENFVHIALWIMAQFSNGGSLFPTSASSMMEILYHFFFHLFSPSPSHSMFCLPPLPPKTFPTYLTISHPLPPSILSPTFLRPLPDQMTVQR